MELTLRPRTLSATSLISELYCDGTFECFILEDIPRPFKEHGKTCIPAGVYDIKVTWSNRFKKQLPQLIDVPDFQGIRIHPGNTSEDTEGCLLPGSTTCTNMVGNSRIAFAKLFTKILNAERKQEPITIDIRRPSQNIQKPNLLS